MTDQQPIRFRTFADEDDDVWEVRAHSDRSRRTGRTAFHAGNEEFGALPPVRERPTRGPAFLAWGTGLALVAGVAIAVTLLPKPGAVPIGGVGPAGALRVARYVAPQPGRLAASALLPCYVNGVAVGPRTVSDCGQRNGVASGRLDVGLASPPVPLDAERLAPRASAPPDTYEDTTSLRQRSPANDGTPSTTPGSRGALTPLATARAIPQPPVREITQPGPYAALPRSYAYDQGTRADQGRMDPEDSVRAAQTFYEGLADADGARASSVVVPEKRRQGPLSPGAIDRFYSGLREPLHLDRLYPVDDHTVVARYDFVDRNGSVCQGTARVTTTQRDGEVYVQSVKAMNGC